MPAKRTISFQRNLSFIIAILFAFSFIASAQSNEGNNKEKIAAALANARYENIKIVSADTTLIIAFENRLYRFEIDAVKDILQIILPFINNHNEIILVPLNRKIPIVKISTHTEKVLSYLDGSLSPIQYSKDLSASFDCDSVYQLFKNEKEYNPSDFEFDLIIKPQFNFEFGPSEKPVISQINLLPELSSGFWTGQNIHYEVICPLYNEFGYSDDSVRTGSAAFNQTFKIPNSIFISASGGIFTKNRYGIDIECTKLFGNGLFSINANLGLTSFIRFSGFKRILYSDEFKFTGHLRIDYRIAQYDLTIGFTLGRFLIGDNSVRLDFNREYGEINIGFFAVKSFNGIYNGGFSISVPLFPSKHLSPNLLRVKTADHYNFSYFGKSNSDELIGLRYDTGNRIDDFLKKLNPNFIVNSFKK